MASTLHKHKLKLLYILKYLKEYSDEEHPVDAEALIKYLEKQDIEVERKSVYSDIDALREFGYNIISAKTPKRGYFLAERKFQLAEVRLLMDAVQSACFITAKKSRQLLEKLELCVSEYQAKNIKNQVYIDNRRKYANEEIYYNIDKLNTAISEGKKIRFKYVKKEIGSDRRFKNTEKELTVSPYALLWSDDRYYIIGNNSKYDNLMHIRIDRMKNVEITKENVRPFDEVTDYKSGFDVADYARRIFNVFSGENDVMELVCKNDAINIITDIFGDDISIRPRSDDRFSFRMPIVISDGLVADILKLGDKVEVVKPDELRERVKSSVNSLYNLYNPGEK